MKRARLEPATGATKDWGLQFIAGLVLVAGIFVAFVGVLLIPALNLGSSIGSTQVIIDSTSRVAMPKDASDLSSLGPWSETTEAELTVQQLSFPVRTLIRLPTAWASLAILIAAWMLFGLLRTIGGGVPFDPGNARRLRILATTVLVGWIGTNALGAWSAQVMIKEANLAGFASPPAIFGLAPFAIAVLIFAVSVAFQEGRALQDDVVGMV